MKRYFAEMFERNNLTTDKEIINWWNKGRGLLNAFTFIFSILHVTIVVLVFKNGWIVFLLPIIFSVFIVVNLIFSVGLLFELLSLRVFKLKINFNNIAPEIKKWELLIAILLTVSLSIFDMLSQWDASS